MNLTDVCYALSQETRLKVFKLLTESGAEGLKAGEISGKLNVPHNTMSFHLSCLSRVGLVSSVREGRVVIYRAVPETLAIFVALLQEMLPSSLAEKAPPPPTKPAAEPERPSVAASWVKAFFPL